LCTPETKKPLSGVGDVLLEIYFTLSVFNDIKIIKYRILINKENIEQREDAKEF